jgi:hypothetical protein
VGTLHLEKQPRYQFDKSLCALEMEKNFPAEIKFSILVRNYFINIIIIIIILTANGFSPGGSGTTIRRNTQITHITQNNTPHSNRTQHTELHQQ